MRLLTHSLASHAHKFIVMTSIVSRLHAPTPMSINRFVMIFITFSSLNIFDTFLQTLSPQGVPSSRVTVLFAPQTGHHPLTRTQPQIAVYNEAIYTELPYCLN